MEFGLRISAANLHVLSKPDSTSLTSKPLHVAVTMAYKLLGQTKVTPRCYTVEEHPCRLETWSLFKQEKDFLTL